MWRSSTAKTVSATARVPLASSSAGAVRTCGFGVRAELDTDSTMVSSGIASPGGFKPRERRQEGSVDLLASISSFPPRQSDHNWAGIPMFISGQPAVHSRLCGPLLDLRRVPDEEELDDRDASPPARRVAGDCRGSHAGVVEHHM